MTGPAGGPVMTTVAIYGTLLQQKKETPMDNSGVGLRRATGFAVLVAVCLAVTGASAEAIDCDKGASAGSTEQGACPSEALPQPNAEKNTGEAGLEVVPAASVPTPVPVPRRATTVMAKPAPAEPRRRSPVFASPATPTSPSDKRAAAPSRPCGNMLCPLYVVIGY